MLYNYLITSWRLLTRERLYAFINAFGLAIGLATCILIFSWVKFEMGYDRHITESERIFRLVTLHKDGGEGIASTYPMVKPRLLGQFPEVEASVRIFDQGFLGAKTRVSFEDKVFTDDRFYYGDSTFFEVFQWPILRGSRNALGKPNAVVLTESTARKYFHEGDPVGKTITAGNREYEVTGVIADVPKNTHFQFDMMATLQAHPRIRQAEETVWSGVVFHTYARLREGTRAVDLEAKINQSLADLPNDPENYGDQLQLRLQPIHDIHLHSDYRFELLTNGNSVYVTLFLTVAVLVLLIAIINYVNLATARHAQRNREVGVRKVLGAGRGQVMGQFMIESMMLSGIAFVIAIGIVQMAHPVLTRIAGYNPLAATGNLFFWVAAFLLVSVTGLVAGVWPSLSLSSFSPVRLFRPAGRGAQGITLRKSLVIFQFTVSVLLTIGTIVIYRQLGFVREARLGLDREQVIALDISFADIRSKADVLKSNLLGNAGIGGVAASSQIPVNIQTGENIDVEGGLSYGVNCISVDPDFFQVMGMEMLAGSDRIAAIRPSDSLNYFVLNEAALKNIRWSPEEALTRTLSIRHGNQDPGPILGIVADFHFQSLHHKVGPLAIEFNPESWQFLLVKVRTADLAGTLAFIQSQWKEVAGHTPLSYEFLDEEYGRLYQHEQQTGTLLTGFAGIALIIALLGLFGLSSFAVEQRTREMGIRKVLGAGSGEILRLFSAEIVPLTFISLLMALPAGFYFVRMWMSSFAYQTSVSAWIYVSAGALNFLLAMFTVIYHGLKVSHVNPVSVLKYE